MRVVARCWYGTRPAGLAGALRAQGVCRRNRATRDLVRYLSEARRVAVVN